jgi:hypothetical protein
LEQYWFLAEKPLIYGVFLQDEDKEMEEMIEQLRQELKMMQCPGLKKKSEENIGKCWLFNGILIRISWDFMGKIIFSY